MMIYNNRFKNDQHDENDENFLNLTKSAQIRRPTEYIWVKKHGQKVRKAINKD